MDTVGVLEIPSNAMAALVWNINLTKLVVFTKFENLRSIQMSIIVYILVHDM